jgi:hypothetical protein
VTGNHDPLRRTDIHKQDIDGCKMAAVKTASKIYTICTKYAAFNLSCEGAVDGVTNFNSYNISITQDGRGTE